MRDSAERLKAPNRPLDLDDLKTSPFKETLAELENVKDCHPLLYLHPSKRWEYPWALQRAKLNKNSAVLDAGSGMSVFPVYLADQGHRVTAMDWDAPFDPAVAEEKVEFVRGDVCRPCFQDDTFDTVFCISVIEHLGTEAAQAALLGLRRVLKKGGRLLLTTDLCQDLNEQLYYEGPDNSFPVDWSLFDEERFRSVILNAPGFEVEGEADLAVDWSTTRPKMREFHGYQYTSVGACLVKN